MVITQEQIDKRYELLKKEAEAAGYHLNPDTAFTKELVQGILENEARYGYGACPCRLASGKKDEDLDIVCPCDYRDADITEFDACYCGLYVSSNVAAGVKNAGSIPERRPGPGARQRQTASGSITSTKLAYPVWRCKVCGYLCARDEAPDTCPVCKVKKDRFERFM